MKYRNNLKGAAFLLVTCSLICCLCCALPEIAVASIGAALPDGYSRCIQVDENLRTAGMSTIVSDPNAAS